MSRHSDQDGDGIADYAQQPQAAPDHVVHDAVRRVGFRHSDPVTDPEFPNITALDGDADDAFPPGWGSTPTERDAAAIAAGNA